MPVFEVLDGGLLTTVQDEGRAGWGHLGVRRAGAADQLAMAAANLLAGAPIDVPVLEMTLVGPRLAVLADVTIGLAGADMEALVLEEDRALAPGRGYRLRAGTTLAFGAADDGARCYLAAGGGLDVKAVLGSASTDPVAHLGEGLDRALTAGDSIAVRDGGASTERCWPQGTASSGAMDSGPAGLAIVEGPHLSRLPTAVREALVEQEWTVSLHADRAGLRLEGDPIDEVAGIDLVSAPMIPGAVQLPPSGQPIVLMPDAPTVGGYPVPAVVAEADRPRAGQLRGGDRLRFRWIELVEARRLARRQAEHLAAVAASFA